MVPTRGALARTVPLVLIATPINSEPGLFATGGRHRHSGVAAVAHRLLGCPDHTCVSPLLRWPSGPRSVHGLANSSELRSYRLFTEVAPSTVDRSRTPAIHRRRPCGTAH